MFYQSQSVGMAWQQNSLLVILWFKFFFGLKRFKPVSFFPFVLDYGNESEKKESKNQTGLNIFKPNKNLNHNSLVMEREIFRRLSSDSLLSSHA